MGNGKRVPWKVCLLVAGVAAVSCCAGIGVTSILTSTPDVSRSATQTVPPTVAPTQITPSATLYVASPTAAVTPTPLADLELLPTATVAVSLPELSAFPGGSCVPNNLVQTGVVTDVVDGDTVKVRLDQDGKVYSVRYIGIDSPEMNPSGQFMASQASAKNEQLVGGKHVTLVRDVSETDRYGRLLRYVVTDAAFVNMELVLKGYASSVAFPPDTACLSAFEQAEQQASALQLGMWAVPTQALILPTMRVRSGQGSCNCSGPDLNCRDFSSHAEAQGCYQYCSSQGYGDVFNLDGDSDGSACESLP